MDFQNGDRVVYKNTSSIDYNRVFVINKVFTNAYGQKAAHIETSSISRCEKLNKLEKAPKIPRPGDAVRYIGNTTEKHKGRIFTVKSIRNDKTCSVKEEKAFWPLVANLEIVRLKDGRFVIPDANGDVYDANLIAKNALIRELNEKLKRAGNQDKIIKDLNKEKALLEEKLAMRKRGISAMMRYIRNTHAQIIGQNYEILNQKEKLAMRQMTVDSFMKYLRTQALIKEREAKREAKEKRGESSQNTPVSFSQLDGQIADELEVLAHTVVSTDNLSRAEKLKQALIKRTEDNRALIDAISEGAGLKSHNSWPLIIVTIFSMLIALVSLILTI